MKIGQNGSENKIRRIGKTVSVRDIVETLEKEIVHGYLKANERMVETEISKRFRVSRTPVREAMRILESNGYVAFAPYKGWKVKEISIDEVKEAYVIRANLASLSTELACRNFTDKDLNLLENILKDMMSAVRCNNIGEYFSLNVKFHQIIEEAGQNGTLSRIMSSLDKMTYRYRFLSLTLSGRLAQSLEEHLKIIGALKKRNPKAAAQAAKESALNAGRSLTKFLLDHFPGLRL